MSLILEALRKSEAERRLGQAPELLATMPVLRAPARHERWPVWIAGLCAAATVLALGWWWMQSMPAARTEVARSEPVAKRSTLPAPTPDANTNAANNAKDDASQTSSARQATQLPVITLPVANAPRPTAPIAGTPAATLASKPVAVLPTPIAPVTASIYAITPKLAAEPVAAPAPSAVTAPAPPVDELALFSLADLSADERNGLPALKVSMHVYADEPAQRFMIINGQRVGEGARIADGVTLVRIRRDGAEIDARGRHLLLPKP